MMKFFDYISILASGKCSFNCDFCIGKTKRPDIEPKISSLWKQFIDLNANNTKLLSVSGDSTDPTFVRFYREIPKYAKKVNSDIKVHLHTKNIDACFDDSTYDIFVLSINENFLNYTDSYIDFLKKLNDKHMLRLSIVITNKNINDVFIKLNLINKLLIMFPGVQLTIRPNVKDDVDKLVNIIKSQYNGSWTINEFGIYVSVENENIWMVDYRLSNNDQNVLYLLHNDAVTTNDLWIDYM